MKLRKNRSRTRLVGLIAGLLSLGLVAAGCGGAGGGGGADGGGGGDAGGGGAAAKSEPIKIGYITWGEDVAATYLWKHILEERGYTVELTQLQVAGLFSGMARGDLDLFLDTWLPTTHEQYWQQYGDQLEKIGLWYDNASLSIAVPEYAPIDSLTQLSEQAQRYNGEIIGIEPGAGLTDITKNQVIPQYNLGDQFRLVTGSTPTMLAQLERSIQNQEPIVVTLWHPHWAYNAYPIKDLKDPKGALGETEQIYTTARSGFSEDRPQVAEWLSNFKMNDEQLQSLENLIFNEYGENEREQAVKEWVSQHQDLVNQWTGGSGS